MNQQKILTALGPLAILYSDPSVTEIMVDAPDRVLVERSNGIEPTDVRFSSAEDLAGAMLALLDACGSSRQPDQSVCEMRFPDGSARALAVFPPVALAGPALVIRKLSTRRITWEEMMDFGFANQAIYEFFQAALRAPANILIAGGTGSGKTTFANRVVELIPASERVVVAEAYHEFTFQHPRAVFLEATGSNISMPELILTAARMRPDWLVVGELLGPEALTLLEVFGRGHSGLSTLHADNAQDALARLEAMCLGANLGLGLVEIRSLICSAVQVISVQHRIKTGARRITEIVELRGQEDGRYVLQPLFRYDPATDQVNQVGQASFL